MDQAGVVQRENRAREVGGEAEQPIGRHRPVGFHRVGKSGALDVLRGHPQRLGVGVGGHDPRNVRAVDHPGRTHLADEADAVLLVVRKGRLEHLQRDGRGVGPESQVDHAHSARSKPALELVRPAARGVGGPKWS